MKILFLRVFFELKRPFVVFIFAYEWKIKVDFIFVLQSFICQV